MDIHEYQAKALLRQYGAPVEDGRPVLRSEHAKMAASELDGPVWVVKAQIHAGGRSKGRFVEASAGRKGGVRMTRSIGEAAREAGRMLGRTLVTDQTGPAGKTVNRVYIETGVEITRELYLALLIDRDTSCLTFFCAPQGGVDIEDNREPITKVAVDIATGYQAYHGRRVAFALGLTGAAIKQCTHLCDVLHAMFLEKDMELVEINPLVVDREGQLKCLDAKMAFDGNASYRHPEILALRDQSEENPRERVANNFELSYIALDGDIGCMVNGAGLAMATMDLIKHCGGEPASFLHVGGTADRSKVHEAFKIITSDPHVKGIFVNIFGGIMRCDIIAEGVVEAVQEVGLKVPLVVRLEGANVAQGKAILDQSGLDVIIADDLLDGAKRIIAAVRS